jgi:hypothetical protein
MQVEKPEPITTPIAPCDLAREHCEQLYNDYREASHFDTVALMMLAYRKGAAIGRAEALNDVVKVIRPKPVDDDRSIMDVARELKQACDHHDAIKADRRAMAKEHNRALRVDSLR